MRLIRLEVANVKKIKWVEVVPREGEPIVVRGKNRAGKSSLLDAIAYLFGGKATHPPQVIREGEADAMIVGETEEFIATRRWYKGDAGDERTELELVAKDGGKLKSPQAILDKLYGDFAFNPLEFRQTKVVDQVAMLRRLTGIDTTDIDARRARVFAERTLVNRDLENAKSRLLPLPNIKPPPKVDVSALLAEQLRLQQAWALAERAASDAHRAQARVKDYAESIARLEEELSKTKALHANAVKVYADADNAAEDATEAAAGGNDRLAAIRTQLEEAQGAAAANAKWEERQKLVAEVEALASKTSAQTAAISDCDALKEALLAKAKFPVPGLGFGPGGVTFNGLPFEQASQAEQVRVSVAMAAALNPKLRVMLVREGSFLDDDGHAILAKLCAEMDMQAWVEVVGENGPASVVIVDGAVRP